MDGLIDSSQLTQTTVDDNINVSYSNNSCTSSIPMLGFYSPLAGYGDSQMSSFDLSTADHFTQQQQQGVGSSQLQVFSQMPGLHTQTQAGSMSQVPMFAWNAYPHHSHHGQHMYHDPQQNAVHPMFFCTPATGTQTPQEPGASAVVGGFQGAGAAEWVPITKVHEPVISPFFDREQRRRQQKQQEMQEMQLHGPTALAEGNDGGFQPDALNSGGGFRGHSSTLGIKVCSVCRLSETPTWRRHPRTGSCVCNACGLYYKLHKRDREWV
ncbi:hypothetical protein H4S06_005010, partial [Coemansia sp. BCRC 34490]